MMRSLFIGLLLSFTAVSQARSFGSSGVGTDAGQFLKIGIGGRAVAMGEAYSAVTDEASALYWNTAGLSRIESKSVVFMHSTYIDSSYFDYVAYGQNLGKYGALGFGIQYFSAGGIEETNNVGVEFGSFTPNDIAFTLGYAYKFENMGALAEINGFSAGMSLKYVRSKIIDTASTVAVDLGILSPAYFNKKLSLALTVANIGGKLKYDAVKEDLPLAIRLGSVYHISDRWLAALDLALPDDNSPYAALGTEYLHPVSETLSIAGRFGINTRTMGDINGITGFNFGLGFILPKWSFDYALVPFGGVATTHRLSVSAKF